MTVDDVLQQFNNVDDSIDWGNSDDDEDPEEDTVLEAATDHLYLAQTYTIEEENADSETNSMQLETTNDGTSTENSVQPAPSPSTTLPTADTQLPTTPFTTGTTPVPFMSPP